MIDAKVLDALLSGARKPGSQTLKSLTPQELKLWALLSTAMETADIATRMVVSERTAKRLVASLLHKLGVTNRIAAARMTSSRSPFRRVRIKQYDCSTPSGRSKTSGATT